MKEWRKRLKGLGKVLLELTSDLLVLIGAVCIAYGASIIYPPAGWIVSGILCIIAAVLLCICKGGGSG